MKSRLIELGMNEKELAIAVKCAQSTMHDTLNSPEAKNSSLVPAIHAALKWAPPGEPEATPIIFSPDALEMAKLYDMLPEDVRRSMKEQAAAIAAIVARKPANQ